MTTQHTLAIIKPTAAAQGHIGDIITCIEQDGFRIKALKMLKLSPEEGKSFYKVHAQRPFFEELYNYIASGDVIVMALEKENAVESFRELIGATDPLQAAPHTIRKKFGVSIGENAIHGSDSPENAKQEISFFFPRKGW